MKIIIVIRLLGLLALLLILSTSETGANAFYALLFMPLFFIGKPWYSYSKKK